MTWCHLRFLRRNVSQEREWDFESLQREISTHNSHYGRRRNNCERKLLHKLCTYFLSSNFRSASEFFQYLKNFVCFLYLRLSYSLSLLHSNLPLTPSFPDEHIQYFLLDSVYVYVRSQLIYFNHSFFILCYASSECLNPACLKQFSLKVPIFQYLVIFFYHKMGGPGHLH